MGNVQASSAGVAPQNIAEDALKEPENTNPGTVEDIHKKSTDIFPAPFEGAKFILNKGLSNHLQVTHSINLTNTVPGSYRFGATYMGTPVSPTEVYPILLGDIDPSGNLQANIIHRISKNIRTKFVTQIQDSEWQVTQSSTDFKGKNSTSSITFANVDIFQKAGVMVAHHLHAITSSLSLGAEAAVQFGPQIPGGYACAPSIVGKYSGTNYTAAGTVGPAGLHLSYHQKCSESLQIATDLETSLRTMDSLGSIGFQVDTPKLGATFKGKIDSQGTVCSVMEKKLEPVPFTFIVSALHNLEKNKSKVGVGFIIG